MIHIFAVSHGAFHFLSIFLKSYLSYKGFFASKWRKENKDLEISSVGFGIFFPSLI